MLHFDYEPAVEPSTTFAEEPRQTERALQGLEDVDAGRTFRLDEVRARLSTTAATQAVER